MTRLLFNILLFVVSLLGMAVLYPERLLVMVRRIRLWLEAKLIEAGEELPEAL